MERITRYAWQILLVILLSCKNEPNVTSTASDLSTSSAPSGNKYTANIISGKYKLILPGRYADTPGIAQKSEKEYGKIVITSPRKKHGSKKRKGLFSACPMSAT